MSVNIFECCGATNNSPHYCVKCLEYVCNKCGVSGDIWVEGINDAPLVATKLRLRKVWWCKGCSELYHRCHRCVCMVPKTETFYCIPCNIFTDVKYPICIGCYKNPRCFHSEEDVKRANGLDERQIKIMSIGDYHCCVSSTTTLAVEINKLKQSKAFEAKL